MVAERSGRSYERNDVINFYTCLTQGFITTFAGMPGTGKTSLARLLAAGLGIEGDDRGHFVEISVERGWTSFHDYIGYFNPLTRSEERSNPEVFSALERLGREADADASAVAPYLFLLDEANLSPIEHYWSPFLRACDSFDHQSMRLPLGGDRALIIPSHTRFVATVNYDHTTEDLSPRFLDRSWVILLRPDDLADLGGDAGLAGVQTSGEAVSYASLTNTFGRRSAISMSEASEEVFKRVLSIMGAARHPVSPRSRQMMAHYITTATELMGASGVSGVYDPVDFAVAQKVLPEISGPREQCESLLEDLAEACARLNVTTEIIERMKGEGDASGYYQFFVF